MSTFKIPVSCIGETGYTVDACAPVAEIQPPDTLGLPILTHSSRVFNRCCRHISISRHDLRHVCNACYRCLTPARAAFNVTVAWVFRQGTSLTYEEIEHAADLEDASYSAQDRDSESCRPFQGPEIDLAPYIWEELVFAQPSRFLCKENCKGMCPGCGINLNAGVCKCSDTSNVEPEGNSAWLAGAAFSGLAPERKG